MNEKIKILVVDDEQKVLNVIEAYLIKEGFEVLTSIRWGRSFKHI